MFYFGDGSGDQPISGVTTTCLMQCNTSYLHRVDQVVDCVLWNVGPLLFNVCAKLLDIGRNWNMRSYPRCKASQTCSKSDMPGEYAGRPRLYTDPCNIQPCVILLQHEVIYSTTIGLRTSSRYLCAFKMLSIKCKCVLCLSQTPDYTITPSAQLAT